MLSTIPSIDHLRRAAKRLKSACEARDPEALRRLGNHAPGVTAPRHADALHVIAREHFFDSWPKLKAAAELQGLDRAARQQRLKVALYHGQAWVAERLLDETPTLADDSFGLLCALYDLPKARAMLDKDPDLATTRFGPRRPLLYLAYSHWIHSRPDLQEDMLALAQLLVTHGADVNDGFAPFAGSDHQLSALYGAIGHARNMPLGQWLLDHGANPNDGESLYHATELGHHDGLTMLLKAGADPKGTNALLRAMDFHDLAAVRLLLAHGARADDFNDTAVAGEAPWTVPALHQAARRGNDAEMAQLLLAHGANPERRHQGVTAYALARAYGNRAVAETLRAAGAQTDLTPEETLLAAAADDLPVQGRYLDPERLAPAYHDLLRNVLSLPGALPHVKRLVAIGLPFDRPDGEGLTPVQVAGWEGLPEVLDYFLSLSPDLTHVNNYGGTLLSTIIHGSENCPDKDRRDHLTCLERVLTHGVALHRQEINGAGREDVATLLRDWAKARPGQLVD